MSEKKRLKAFICVLTGFIILAMSAYINTYYKASEETAKAISNAEKSRENVLVFRPENDIECGLIFYPGGKVEYTAYAPLMEKCAEEGILCVLMKMPCNLAVFDVKAADGIQEIFPEIEEWYMAGHSLGGAMAASYAGKHQNEYDGLILLASYSTEDLSSAGLDVLSVYGTEDHVLNREKYQEYEEKLPDNYIEEIIEGGCHAYFGNYGEQEGDGTAWITREEQQKVTVDIIKKFTK